MDVVNDQLDDVLERMEREAMDRSLAANTRRGYQSDLKDFEGWLAKETSNQHLYPTPDVLLRRYFIERSQTLSKATLARRIASIAAAHKDRGMSARPHSRSFGS